jgi:hypothetical protein
MQHALSPQAAKNSLRAKANFAIPSNEFSAFKPGLENISLFQNRDSRLCPRRPAFLSEGRLAIVTDVEGGMRWTRW